MIDYYYEQLNFTERRIYKSIYVSIVNKESYVYIAHIKKENLEKIYIGISYDHPEIYYVDFSTVNYEIDSCRIRLIFEYLFSRGILAIIENKTNQEIERIVSAMSSNSGKGIIQIEKSIHDYMVNSISYDYEALRNKSMNRCSFNIYGVINNRLAVCEGIAKFVKLTLNKLGIECFICGGKCTLENEKIEDHAWNIIKIEEDYYHIDVTWDIRKDDAQNKRIVSYDYFNLDDANISRDHFDFNMSFECTSMLYNYHAIMGRFISGKKQLIQLLSDGLALAWLSKSNDTCYGYYNLAQCYIKGIGTSKNLERGVSYLERAVEGKCLHLSEARRQLVDLYSKGYGGPDAKRKMGEIQEEINQSDKLMDELASLILSDSNN